MVKTSEGHRNVQYLASLCVTISLIYHGVLQGWPSPVLPKLLSGETNIEIDKQQCSWLASLTAFGAPVGCFAAQYLGDSIGRKKTILSLAIPGIVGSGMLLFITTPFWMYVARFTTGVAGAMAIVEVSIYLGEIADKDIRGALGSLIIGMANLGNLLIYGIGPFISYNAINWMCLSLPIIFLIACLWIPESPYFHLKNNDLESAKNAMMKLKGLKSSKSIDEELVLIHIQVKKDMENKSTISELFKKKEYRKALIAMMGLKVLQQMTGTLAIQSYLETIFRQTSLKISGPTTSIIYGVVQMIAGFASTFTVDKMGKKPLLIISSLGTGISLTAVGLYFYFQNVLKYEQEVLDKIGWLPLAGIIGFTVLFAIGLGNLPYIIQSEVFPTNVRSAASSVITASGAMMAFSVAKSFQSLTDEFGVHTVFWIFAAIAYVGVVFIYYCVPETTGKSLEDVIRKLNKTKGNPVPEEIGTVLEEMPLKSDIDKKIDVSNENENAQHSTNSR